MAQLCNLVLEKTQETGGPQRYSQEKKNIQVWSLSDQRQHPDDLYHHLLDNRAWESIIDRAHDLEVPLEDETIDQTKTHVMGRKKKS